MVNIKLLSMIKNTKKVIVIIQIDIFYEAFIIIFIFFLMKDQAEIPPDFQDPDYAKILEGQDFFPKIFLIPSEIKLDSQQGLKIIKRSLQRPDKFEEQYIQDIENDMNIIKSYNKQQNRPGLAGQGLLSLFKRTSTRRIKLAICICVYSQPKHMLKNTIKGIQESYKSFAEQAGIHPHQIIITVIFDGLEKMNNNSDQTENMISFFHEIDLKNKFVRKPNGKSIDEYFRDLQQQNFNLSRLKEENDENFSLFTAEQMQQLHSKLFQNQYQQYIRIKQILKEIEELKKKKNLKSDSLPIDIYKKYEQVCKNFCIQNNLYFDTQEQIQEYLENKRNIKTKLMYEAISETQVLCKRYLQSRQDKAILYPVRLETEDLLYPIVDIDEEQLQISKKKIKKQYNYMFFVVKYRNQGKLSSHLLFFQGFCKLFDPHYCMLTDVGMRPQKDAVYRMWRHLELNQKCGGLCTYMNLKLQSGSDDLGYRVDGFDKNQVGRLTRITQSMFSIQRAQQFQYHFAHMLDKPFQSFFNYIHVLPGAFSAYRWKALKSIPYKQEQPNYLQREGFSQTQRHLSQKSLNDEYEQQQTIMRRYLKMALLRNQKLSLEDSNMYLAEDRIMCLGLHALGYNIQFLPDVESTVDPVTSLTRLLGQRRRWINGSWFAFNYVRKHYYQRTSCIFLVQIIYYTFVQALTWIGPALFYITMNLTLIAAVREYVVPIFLDFFGQQNDYDLANYRIGIFQIKQVIQSIPDVINYIYILLIFSVVLYSLMVNNNNPSFKRIYYSASTALGIYGLIIVALLGYNTNQIFFEIGTNTTKKDFIIPVIYLRAIILFIIVGHALPILWSLKARKYIECMAAFLPYIFYAPTYINLLQIFSFCRIDDLSWGTKGLDNSGESQLDEDQMKIANQWTRRKYVFVLQYVSTNILFSFLILKLSDFDYPRNLIILISMCLVAFLLLFRLVPAFIYLLVYMCKRIWGKKLSPTYRNDNFQNGNRILNILNQIQLKSKQIQKMQVKKKKEQQYKQAATLTSKLLSKNLNNYGNKLRSRVTQHMLNNQILLNKDLDPKKSKKRINLRKKLKIVEQASLQDSDGSQNGGKSAVAANKINYKLIVPDPSKMEGLNIKQKLKALKMKKSEQK